MDNTKMLLSEWGVPEEFIVNFRENQISLKDLDGVKIYILKELIPPIKIRMKGLKELRKLKQSDEKFSEIMIEVSSISTSNRSEISTDVNIEDQPFDLSNVTFGSLENFLFKPRFSEFDLKTLLSVSPLRNTVLNYYERYMKLDETRRNRLVDRIVKHIFNFIVQSFCMAHIIPPKGNQRTGKHTWKFSILESLERILVHVKQPGDVYNAVALRKDKAYKKKQTVQPYLLVEGDSIENLRSYYLSNRYNKILI